MLLTVLSNIGIIAVAFVVALVVVAAIGHFTENNLIKITGAFLATAAISQAFTLGTYMTYAVIFSPILVPFLAIIVSGILFPPLERRGYMGNVKKWKREIDTNKESVDAALTLLSDDEVEKVGDISSSAQDFEENLLRAAGLDDYEAPGIDGR